MEEEHDGRKAKWLQSWSQILPLNSGTNNFHHRTQLFLSVKWRVGGAQAPQSYHSTITSPEPMGRLHFPSLLVIATWLHFHQQKCWEIIRCFWAKVMKSKCGFSMLPLFPIHMATRDGRFWMEASNISETLLEKGHQRPTTCTGLWYGW